MNAADRLTCYAVTGLQITLSDDGRLRVCGPDHLREMARPSLLRHKAALVVELRRRGAFDTITAGQEAV
jgi:hypothetical protein